MGERNIRLRKYICRSLDSARLSVLLLLLMALSLIYSSTESPRDVCSVQDPLSRISVDTVFCIASHRTSVPQENISGKHGLI